MKERKNFLKSGCSAQNAKRLFRQRRKCLFADGIFASANFYRVGSEIFQIMEKTFVLGHSTSE